jgi:nucleoside phosphorylase
VAIYLNYLDREFGRSVNCTLSPSLLRSVTDTILICSFEPLYCGLSLFWEQPAVRLSWDYFSELIRCDQLELTTAYASGSDFLAAKRSEYSYDRRRYPGYFTTAAERQLALPIAFRHVSSRTTPVLVKSLAEWAETSEFDDLTLSAANRRELSEIVTTTLAHRNDEAVTLSLFRAEFEGTNAGHRFSSLVARAISERYTRHYQELMSGRSPTGVRGLSFYDVLGKSFPYLDYPVLGSVLKILGVSRVDKRGLVELLSTRGGREHLLFNEQLRRLLLASVNPDGEIASRRLRLMESLPILRRHLKKRRNAESWRAEFAEGAERLADLLKEDYYRRRIDEQRLEFPSEPTLDAFCSFFERSRFSGAAEILLVVATDVEKAAVLARFSSVSQEFFGPSTYYRGTFAGRHTVLTQCEKGSVGRDSATLTINDAIKAVHPRAVIMVGIAFGANRKKQKIGDVLVSESVYPYEPERIGENESVPRGTDVPSGLVLSNRFRELRAGWSVDDAKVHFGRVLSGEKLVDNPEFRARLLKMKPDAIGGEMEGAGLCAAAARNGVEWILVKAICDWADGTKHKRYQKMAAGHAVSFVEHVLSVPGVLDELAATA